jgi:hypothetical protein
MLAIWGIAVAWGVVAAWVGCYKEGVVIVWGDRFKSAPFDRWRVDTFVTLDGTARTLDAPTDVSSRWDRAA